MLLRTAVAVCLTSIVMLSGAAVSDATAHSGLLVGKPASPQARDLQFVKMQRQGKRRRVPKKYKDLAVGVGLLVNYRSRRFRHYCTAFCVGSDLIASNAHCLEGKPDRKHKYNLRSMAFELREKNGRTKRSKLEWNRIGRRGEPQLSLLIDDVEVEHKESWHFRDWAVARLQKKLCARHVLRFADQELLSAWPWFPEHSFFMIGYNGGLRISRKWRSYNECQFFERNFYIYGWIGWHGCYGVSGSSGSPIFVETGYGPRVVAINYLQVRRPKSTRAKKEFVVPFPDWVTNGAVIPTRLVERLDRFAKSRFIKKRTSLVKLQRKLKKAGYFEGKIGNRYVSATRQAIFRYETANGQTPLGIPTQELLDELAK